MRALASRGHSTSIVCRISQSLFFLVPRDVRELAALRAEEPEPLEILGAVVRADVEPFRRFPYQLFLVVGSLEVRFDRLLPPLGRDRGKFGEKLLLFICHSVFD